MQISIFLCSDCLLPKGAASKRIETASFLSINVIYVKLSIAAEGHKGKLVLTGFGRRIGNHGISAGVGINVVGIGRTALALAVNEVMLMRRNVVRIGLTALALTVNEVMLMRRNVVRIGLTALALTVNEVMLVRRNVFGIGRTALALTVNKGVLMRSNVFGIGLTAFALTVNKVMLVITLACYLVYQAARRERKRKTQAKSNTKN